jgi:prepilin-type N-terminal cleavage/methylation domain-containing protein
MKARLKSHSGGFTLIELLVVLLIILLVSAVTLPFLAPALAHRQVSEAARILQAGLVGARDTAIRANEPRGIRLLPDPAFQTNPSIANPFPALAYNRYITIEPGPIYNEGRVSIVARPGAGSAAPQVDGIDNGQGSIFGGPVIPGTFFPPPAPPMVGGTLDFIAPPLALRIEELPFDPVTGSRNSPTSWYWNVRRGDQIRFGQAGRLYNIVGPVVFANPEGFINVGLPGTFSPLPDLANNVPVEYLLLTNGQDDNGNGLVDEGFDGNDNNNNGLFDELAEWEVETFVGTQFTNAFVNQPYVILKRPVPSQSAHEVTLPSDVVIDATTWNAASPFVHERSRLPIDPATGYVEIMLAPNGQVVQAGGNGSYGPPLSLPFYHFWLGEREDVADGHLIPGVPYLLPMPASTPFYPSQNDPNPRLLKGERRLITIFTKTGQVTTNSIDTFNGLNPALPFIDPQSGAQEEIQ